MIAWLLANWKPALCGLLLLASFEYGVYSGASRANRKWEAEIAESRRKAQDSADRHAEEYEAERAKDKAALDTIKEELAREKKNPAYASCRAGENFVKIYQRISE